MAVSLLKSALLYCSVLLCLQLFTVPASSQIVVDNDKFCNTLSLKCGQPGGPDSQKYCCAEGNGNIPIYRCCNPYTGLFIGIGVSVPIIVILIVLCCVLYFVYARYRRKKLQALLQSYHRRSRRGRSESASTSFVAPPPYTPLEHDEAAKPGESELPPYSEVDQFAATAITIAHGQTPPTSTHNDTPPTANVASSESAAAQSASGESTEIPLEDVPLLSDNDENES